MKFEYVASGAGYMRLASYLDFEEREQFIPLINSWFKTIEEKADRHSMALLFNAFTEESFGRKLSPYETVKYGDSGGLQIITQGLSITDELKQKVYKTQAEWADISMSFDEIPIKMREGLEKTSRGNLNDREFDRDGLDFYAKKTGENLRKQIESFLEDKTKSKPLFVAQGNCMDSYVRWTETALKEIPEDMQKHIGGVAMAGTSFGYGELENFEKAFIYAHLPIKTTHQHLLAVGAVKRVLPSIIFSLTGLYDNNTLISYDSTSQTSAAHFGSYYAKGYNLKRYLKSYDDKVLNEMTDDFFESFDGFPFSREEFMTTWVHTDAEGYAKKHDDYMGRYLSTTAAGMIQIKNVADEVEDLSISKERFMEKMVEKRYYPKHSALINWLITENPRTLNDFNYWKKTAVNELSSKRIKDKADSDLSAWF